MNISMLELQKYERFFLRAWRVRDHIIIYANDPIKNLAHKNWEEIKHDLVGEGPTKDCHPNKLNKTI